MATTAGVWQGGGWGAALRRLGRGVRGWARVAVGSGPADEATRRERRAACAACPEARRTRRAHRLAVLTPASTCGVCRCQLLAKTRLTDEACPQGKW